MPNMEWSQLSKMQLGRYAEYYAKMEFTSYGFEVYTSEVDDHGLDFIIKSPNKDTFYEIQVKSIRDKGYIFIEKTKMANLDNTRLVCVLRFTDGNLPEFYIIPASAWKQPNDLLVDRNYNNTKSKPEWGINISKKNLELLNNYSEEKIIKKIK